MRLRVRHHTSYHFGVPTRGIVQSLRLNPRNHDGQHVASWRIDISADCRLKASEDAFGNWTHIFDCEGPLEQLDIQVTGEVETVNTAGVLRHSAERLPPELYLRETRLTFAEPRLRDFAEAAAGAEAEPLGKLHTLLDHVFSNFEVVGGGRAAPRLGEVIEAGRGTAADLAHVFIASARHFDIPARCVEGYCMEHQELSENASAIKSPEEVALHVWAEAHVNGLGWVGFDPSSGYCPRESHVRVAVGLDHQGASPIRCARKSGRTDSIDSRIVVSAA